ncbi:MAG: apolipoprotein N-acyltransferase [bacterium]
MLTRLSRMLLPPEAEVRWRRLELMGWAFLFSLSFYPGPFGFLAWFCLIRPLWIIASLPTRPAFNAAYLYGFFFNLFTIYWLAWVTPPGMIAAVIIVAFYYAGMLMVFHRLYHLRPLFGFIAMPFLWAGLEYFRTLSEFAFPWADLGYTQSFFLQILQIVSIISVHGLTIIVVAVNVLLWQVFRPQLSAERRITAVLVAAATVAALVAYGWIEMPKYPEDGDIKISLLQGSVSIEDKWREGNTQHSLDIYDSLATSTREFGPQLIVWPETSVPCYLTHDHGCRRQVSNIARRTGTFHLAGALAATTDSAHQHYYNACFQYDSLGRDAGRYDKVKLVPFSEHVPYQDRVPFLQQKVLRKYLTIIDQWGVQWWSDFYPGDSLVLFEIPDALYGVAICFECAFPDYMRRYLLDGADFVVGITNDTWFEGSVGLDMHARMFITRAVENRCWMARAANSGYTFVVDPWGRMRDSLKLGEVAALNTKVAALDGFSIFTRTGDVAGRAAFLFSLSLVGILSALWISSRFTKP